MVDERITSKGERVEVRPKRRRKIADFRGLFPVERAAWFAEERAAAWDAMTEWLRADRRD